MDNFFLLSGCFWSEPPILLKCEWEEVKKMKNDFLTKVLEHLSEVEDQQISGLLTEEEAEKRQEQILRSLQEEVLRSHR